MSKPACPTRADYEAVKAENPGCVVFFRVGDFYELYFEDALLAAETVRLTLTTRGKSEGKFVPMCGFPIHALNTYIDKFAANGVRTAICEKSLVYPQQGPQRESPSMPEFWKACFLRGFGGRAHVPQTGQLSLFG